jgi:hypothetical protein
MTTEEHLQKAVIWLHSNIDCAVHNETHGFKLMLRLFNETGILFYGFGFENHHNPTFEAYLNGAKLWNE